MNELEKATEKAFRKLFLLRDSIKTVERERTPQEQSVLNIIDELEQEIVKTENKNEKEEYKYFHIDAVIPPLDFDEHESFEIHFPRNFAVRLTRSEVEKINREDFNCNFSNMRSQNMDMLKAFIGAHIDMNKGNEELLS